VKPPIGVPFIDTKKDENVKRFLDVPTVSSLWDAMKYESGDIVVFNPRTQLFYVLQNYQISPDTPTIAKQYFPDCDYDIIRHVIVPFYSSETRKPYLSEGGDVKTYQRHPPFETEPPELVHSEYNYDSEDDDDIEKILNNQEFGVQLIEIEELENDEFVQSIVDENISVVVKMFTKVPTKLVLSEKDLIRIRMFSRKHILDADVEALELDKARAKFTEKAKQNDKSKEWVSGLVKEYLEDLQKKGLTDVRYTVVACIALILLTSFPNKISTLPVQFSFEKSNVIDLLDLLINVVNEQDTSDKAPLDIENAYSVYRRIAKKPLWEKLINKTKKSIDDNKTIINRENMVILERYYLWNTFKPLSARKAEPEKKINQYKMKEDTIEQLRLVFPKAVFLKQQQLDEPPILIKQATQDQTITHKPLQQVHIQPVTLQFMW
jgi:hypothetical protein